MTDEETQTLDNLLDDLVEEKVTQKQDYDQHKN